MTDLLSRSLEAIPGGAQTFSKRRDCWPDIAPSHLVRGTGAHVWDPHGNEYIDLACALGAVTLGYRDPDVENSVSRQLSAGPLFSLPHPLEVGVAESLTRVIPCAKDGGVRFLQTGTEATAAAIRAARYYTGRVPILSAGYHGWADWCCPNPAGIPRAVRDQTRVVARLPEELVEDRCVPSAGVIEDRCVPSAAVIVEPEAFSNHELGMAREWCDRHGAVLIFDEVLTGFRVGHGGYQQCCGVIPDLAVFSKALGNGHPVAAVMGRSDVMCAFEAIGVSGTFAGEAIGLAAAAAVIAKTEQSDYYERLQRIGSRLRESFHSAARDAGVLALARGLDTHWVPEFFGDEQDIDPIIHDERSWLPRRTLYRQEMVRRGILIGPHYVFASYALSESDLEHVDAGNRVAFRAVASAKPLIGAPARSGIRAAWGL